MSNNNTLSFLIFTLLTILTTVTSQPGGGGGRRGGGGNNGGNGGGGNNGGNGGGGGNNNNGGNDGGNNNNDNDNNILLLSQSDFDEGTIVITTDGLTIQLTEDIVFNPRRNINDPNGEGSYFPLSNQNNIFPGADKTSGAFRLGFFAGISIEANDIIFDLQGFQFSAHLEFMIQQRFFTLIGIGTGPFISGEGPTDFGPNRPIVNNIEIRNGVLGPTQHHGIHGNLMSNVVIHDISIIDYEIAGIHLNGFNNVHIYNINIGPTLTSVPVIGRYTQARFGLLSFRDIRERLELMTFEEIEENYSIQFNDRDESLNVIEIMDRLQDGMDLWFNFIVFGTIPSVGTSEFELFQEARQTFENADGLPDGGSMYGIVLSSAGAQVNWFGAQTTPFSNNAVIENVVIHDLQLNVREIVAYWTENGEHATGPYKGVLSMDLALDLENEDPDEFDLSTDSINNYHGNLLSDAQIALALFGLEDIELQRQTIDNELIQWATTSNTALEDGDLICNGDCQFHMDKGIIGIRVDRTNNLNIFNTVIENLHNYSPLGSEFCNIHDTVDGTNYFTHPETPSYDFHNGEYYKYQGRVSRGIALTDVTGNINLQNIDIDEIISDYGSAIGIEILGIQTSQVNLINVINIEDIEATDEIPNRREPFYLTDNAFPNNNVVACGLYSSNANGQFNQFVGSNVIFDDIDGAYVCPESIGN